MQVAPATQSSCVGTQQTQQHLQPEIATVPLLGIAPGPQLVLQVASENIQGPGDLTGSSVSPVPCQCSLGHLAHSPETDDRPQAKRPRPRYQDPLPPPNGLPGVAKVSLALQLVSLAHCVGGLLCSINLSAVPVSCSHICVMMQLCQRTDALGCKCSRPSRLVWTCFVICCS